MHSTAHGASPPRFGGEANSRGAEAHGGGHTSQSTGIKALSRCYAATWDRRRVAGKWRRRAQKPARAHQAAFQMQLGLIETLAVTRQRSRQPTKRWIAASV
ncbi:MAG: hypothetical protein ABI647_26840 [Gemmatimonadota bacterium]